MYLGKSNMVLVVIQRIKASKAYANIQKKRFRYHCAAGVKFFFIGNAQNVVKNKNQEKQGQTNFVLTRKNETI